jgi:hypothetical protein
MWIFQDCDMVLHCWVSRMWIFQDCNMVLHCWVSRMWIFQDCNMVLHCWVSRMWLCLITHCDSKHSSSPWPRHGSSGPSTWSGHRQHSSGSCRLRSLQCETKKTFYVQYIHVHWKFVFQSCLKTINGSVCVLREEPFLYIVYVVAL